MTTVFSHLKNKLPYRYGFCLHSLPQANSYYQEIGMVGFGPDSNKENLHYYEMMESETERFINA